MTPEMMMGNGGAQPSQGPESNELNDQLRNIIMQIGRISQQVPEAEAEFQVAAKALTAASLKVVAGQREPPVQQPVVAA